MRHAAPVIFVLLTLAACTREPAPPEGRSPGAPEPQAAAGLFAGDLDARGTEPFWALRIRPESLVLSRPDHPDLAAENTGAHVADDAAVWAVEANDQPLIVTIRERECSDGMSDLRYPLEVQVVFGAEALRGCGFRAG